MANAIVRIDLHFERSCLSIDVGDDDELRVTPSGVSELGASDFRSLVWKQALGSPLFSYWRMTNHQGYADAIQLFFGPDTSDRRPMIQMQAMASTVVVLEVADAGAVCPADSRYEERHCSGRPRTESFV